MITPDKIIRTHRKTLAVCISPTGTVIVRAPISCDTARIFAFLQEKEAWILRQKSKKESLNALLPPQNLDGYAFSFLGKQTQIRLHTGKHIHYNESENTLLVPQTNATEKVQKFLKESAKKVFAERTERLAQRMGARYQSVCITSAKTRWGSCSGKNAIRFSFRLVYAPVDVIDYVIAHELAHVKHKNHSKNFWREVEKYHPDFKAHRVWLKNHAYFMQIF